MRASYLFPEVIAPPDNQTDTETLALCNEIVEYARGMRNRITTLAFYTFIHGPLPKEGAFNALCLRDGPIQWNDSDTERWYILHASITNMNDKDSATIRLTELLEAARQKHGDDLFYPAKEEISLIEFYASLEAEPAASADTSPCKLPNNTPRPPLKRSYSAGPTM